MDYFGILAHTGGPCLRGKPSTCRRLRVRHNDRLDCVRCGYADAFDARRGPVWNRRRRFRVVWACEVLPHICALCGATLARRPT